MTLDRRRLTAHLRTQVKPANSYIVINSQDDSWNICPNVRRHSTLFVAYCWKPRLYIIEWLIPPPALVPSRHEEIWGNGEQESSPVLPEPLRWMCWVTVTPRLLYRRGRDLTAHPQVTVESKGFWRRCVALGITVALDFVHRSEF
jgi:hypothetical protein